MKGLAWREGKDKRWFVMIMMKVNFGRLTPGPRLIARESSQKLQTCGAHKPSNSAVLSRSNGGQWTRPTQKIHATISEGSPSDSPRSEDTLKLLDSLLGSVDESDVERTINNPSTVSISASDIPTESNSLEDVVSVQQLSAPLQGDIQTSIRCAVTPPIPNMISLPALKAISTQNVISLDLHLVPRYSCTTNKLEHAWACRRTREADASPIAQGLVQNAKGFLLDKLKRATAEDLIVDEDAAALPKVLPTSNPAATPC